MRLEAATSGPALAHQPSVSILPRFSGGGNGLLGTLPAFVLGHTRKWETEANGHTQLVVVSGRCKTLWQTNQGSLSMAWLVGRPTHSARRVRGPTRRPTYLELPDERRKEAKAWLLTS